MPFRGDRLVMPNNWVQAFKRLMFLKRRFLKDQKFFDDYKKFMDNLLVKGYAKQSEVVLSGKTWYIPHHGVYHPSKPGKIRVDLIVVLIFKENPSIEKFYQDLT